MKETHRYRSRLKALFDSIKDLPDDGHLKAHYARYLCILMSGYLEVSVKEVLGGYAKKCTNEKVCKFVSTHVNKLQNPKMEKILELCGAFSINWQEQLTILVEGEIRDAVDSVVNTRNQIAHGQDTGITLTSVQKYFQQLEKLVAHMKDVCDPD